MIKSNRIGIDLGGTKIAGIVLAPNGSNLGQKRVSTPRGCYRDILMAVRDLILSLKQVTDYEHAVSIGIGTPGAIDVHSGLIKNANSTELNGKPLLTDLEELLGQEISIANDANCLALSEATDGAGAGAKIVMGIILGTGVGGGLVINGEVIGGVNAIAGEWGHNPLPNIDDEVCINRCYCGQQGCIETFLSGPGMATQHQQLFGEKLSAKEIVYAAENSEANALHTLNLYEGRLAAALGLVINIVDPEVIVLGGGLSNIARLYENVPKLWRNSIFSDQINTRLVAPQFGDSSGVRGAAWLWH